MSGTARPIPDVKELKSTVLSWDFYKEIRDESDLQRAEEAKLLSDADVRDRKLELKDIEELLLDLTHLSEAQKKRKKRDIEKDLQSIEKLPAEEKEAKLKEREMTARSNLAKRLAHQRMKESAALGEVPQRFEDEAEYVSSFLPLYFREAQAQIQRCKDSEMEKETEQVALHAFRLDPPFVKLEFTRTKDAISISWYSIHDLVLVTQGQDLNQPHPTHLLGLVDHSVGSTVQITVFVDMEDTTPGSRMKEAANLIATRASWYICKVTSFSTLMREYEALKAVPEIFLKDTILNREEAPDRGDQAFEMQAASALEVGAEPAAVKSEETLHLPEAVESWLHQRYNTSQQNAINDSKKVSGITLVQGPPGTGKTTTVLGILSVLLSATATQAQAVSYSKGKSDKPKAGTEASDDSPSEDEEEIERRKQERIKLLQARAPWLRGNYVPLCDQNWQEVSRAGSVGQRMPYPKVAEESVKNMSEIRHTIAPQKVLVCGPSNASIDEVMRRIVKDGCVNEIGERYQPPMIRMGPNAHPDLKDFSMNALVHKRLQAGCDMPDFQKKESEKTRLLQSSRLICSTLSISGHRDMVNFPEDFDTVVIDEASQGVEVSTLVPLKLGCRRLILVGDPEQLPATCFSEIAKDHKYDRSLFQRLQQTQYKVNMLNTQYRMHPDISQFPSVNFYDGNLLDFRDKEAFESEYPTSWSHIPCLAPVAFFNLAGTMREESKSYVNEDEANFIKDFFACLRKAFPKEDWRRKLAVISPYAQQVNLIRHKFRKLYNIGDKEPCPVDVSTVDAFQGREKDCIMVSLVRGAQLKSKTVGFLRDRRRMNVAFTRARLNLWVVGAAKVLSFNEDWKEFIDLLAGKCRLLRVTEPREDFLLRYLKRWHERNPRDDSAEGSAVLEAQSEESDCLLEAKDVFQLSPEEMDELRTEEAERLRYERDVEEVDEDDGIDPEEMAQSGVKRKAEDAFHADFQQEEAPTRKEQNDDAEPEEEAAEG